ncbi:MAG: F0F1 ATP synthase subunit beta [Candidatus Omnitrophota bacterium]
MADNTIKKTGRVVAVQGPVVDVKFEKAEEIPGIYQVIITKTFDGKELLLEVTEHLEGNIARCVALASTLNLQRNQPAVAQGSPISIPVGKSLFSRIINVVGEPIDSQGPIVTSERMPIRKDMTSFYLNPDRHSLEKLEILETGIKIMDLLFPMVKGSKSGILGGAALGKSILTLELIHNVTQKSKGVCVFTGAGERIREGNELYNEFKKQGLLDRVIMAFGQMNEPPGARYEIVLTGVTVAEYLQSQNQDVLFFVDNVYRFVQAGAEISTLLGRVPSEMGYQPTLASEVGEFQERIRSRESGSITAVEAIYVPADDLTDPAVVTIFSYLDAVLVLSRERIQLGLYPAIDPLLSSCSNLDPEIVGERHFIIAQEVVKILTKYEELKKIVAVIGVDELSKVDRILYERARKLQNFLTQPFFTAEVYTGKKGEYVTIKETLDGCEKIISGRADTIKEEDLYLIGKL